MKKIVSVLCFLVMFSAVPAFAATYGNLTFPPGTPGTYKEFNGAPAIPDGTAADVTFTLSPNVGIAYTVTDSNDGYTLVAANAQGTKGYGLQHDFQGVLMTSGDYNDEGAPDTDSWGDAWIVMGSPDAPLPGGTGSGTGGDDSGGDE